MKPTLSWDKLCRIKRVCLVPSSCLIFCIWGHYSTVKIVLVVLQLVFYYDNTFNATIAHVVLQLYMLCYYRLMWYNTYPVAGTTVCLVASIHAKVVYLVLRQSVWCCSTTMFVVHKLMLCYSRPCGATMIHQLLLVQWSMRYNNNSFVATKLMRCYNSCMVLNIPHGVTTVNVVPQWTSLWHVS